MSAEPSSAPRPADAVPPPLRARADRDPLAARAERAAEQLAPLAESPRLEGRFAAGIGGLAEALRGLAAMRSCDFAPRLAAQAQAALEEVLAAAEDALEAARPELEAERRALRAARRRPGGSSVEET